MGLNPFGTGKVFKPIMVIGGLLRRGRLNPFGTGKVFKHPSTSNAGLPSDVLIPSEQGKCSNLRTFNKGQGKPCLNPFGTGKVFKHILTAVKQLSTLS